MLYNTEIVVDYNKIEENDESDTCYRKQLLTALDLSLCDFYSEDSKLNQKIIELFKIIPKENEILNSILKDLAGRLLIEDNEFGFIMLFSYDMFYLTHLLLREFILQGTLNQEVLENMKKIV